jgi:hypothetical protein
LSFTPDEREEFRRYLGPNAGTQGLRIRASQGMLGWLTFRSGFPCIRYDDVTRISVAEFRAVYMQETPF